MAKCVIPGCDRKVTARGWCPLHYKRWRRHGDPLRTCRSGGQTHGRSRTPEYAAWIHMLDRCYNASNPGYSNYGGRGIRVCDRWITSFANFLSDLGERPSANHMLDRIDNDGNYTPSNCRWATPRVQGNNKRNNRLITYGDKTLTLSQWTAELHLPRGLIDSRLRAGWSISEALTVPNGQRRKPEMPYAKLTVDAVLQIRADNRRAIDIARAHGIKEGTVFKIKRRATWRHV